jgi:hypothetical protein
MGYGVLHVIGSDEIINRDMTQDTVTRVQPSRCQDTELGGVACRLHPDVVL